MAPHSTTLAWKIPWTEEPGGLQSMGSLGVGHDWVTFHFDFSLSCIGEGNGNPLQCSCLENSRDGGAWWAAFYGVAQSRTRLKRLSSSSSSKDYEHLHIALQGLVPTDCTNSVWEFHSSTSSSEIVLSGFNFCLADKCKMIPNCCLIMHFPWSLGRLVYMFFGQFGFFSYVNCLFVDFCFSLLCYTSFSSWNSFFVFPPQPLPDCGPLLGSRYLLSLWNF